MIDYVCGHYCQFQYLLQGGLISYQSCAETSHPASHPPVVTRIQHFPSPSMSFLGTFQFTGVCCFRSLIAKGRNPGPSRNSASFQDRLQQDDQEGQLGLHSTSEVSLSYMGHCLRNNNSNETNSHMIAHKPNTEDKDVRSWAGDVAELVESLSGHLQSSGLNSQQCKD